MSVLVGKGLLGRLVELGIIPQLTRRVVIEASVDDVTMIYVEQYGDRRLLNVEAADFLGVKIVMEGNTNGDSD